MSTTAADDTHTNGEQHQQQQHVNSNRTSYIHLFAGGYDTNSFVFMYSNYLFFLKALLVHLVPY
jgi:hypothetical protein